MLVVEFSVTPLDKGDSIAKPVAKTVEIISRSGLSYEVGPMATIIEGDWIPVMTVINECLQELKKDSDRIMFSIRGDLRNTKEARIEKNVERVEESLNRNLSS